MTDAKRLSLHASHTHLYPGAGGRYAGTWRDGPCALEFSDGNVVQARLVKEVLEVPEHRTLAGTRIAQKRWEIRGECDGFTILRAA
ncbi:hypothetical protein [Pseudoruegeria sp. HB172150]|uniref:hypothetical protein n=1 Tax=Pseudoruegeria sp. HB172150 TaxID=2721164 RepID=UPI0015544ED4|nr:hypothetical protein [Pseudoruegeria sp. HB172150]